MAKQAKTRGKVLSSIKAIPLSSVQLGDPQNRRRCASMSRSEALATVREFCATRDPAALSEQLLPALTRPWPEKCEAYWALQGEADESEATNRFNGMRSAWLPLYQQEQLVQCTRCKRMLFIDTFETHQAVCKTLNVEDILAEEEGRMLKPTRSGAGGGVVCGADAEPLAPRAIGRGGRAGRGGRSAGGRGGEGDACGVDDGLELQPPEMWSDGTLNLDVVCGVRKGQKLCHRPLNCKYHSIHMKRLVRRSMPYDELAARQKAQGVGTPPLPGLLRRPNSEGLGADSQPREQTVLPEVDPFWNAEWARMLAQMPTVEDAEAALWAGERSAWPKPLFVKEQGGAPVRLWGVPVAEMRSGEEPEGDLQPDAAGAPANSAMTASNVIKG